MTEVQQQLVKAKNDLTFKVSQHEIKMAKVQNTYM